MLKRNVMLLIWDHEGNPGLRIDLERSVNDMTASFSGKRQLELWFEKRLICPIIKDKDCFDQQKTDAIVGEALFKKSLELPKITSTSPSPLFQSWLLNLPVRLCQT